MDYHKEFTKAKIMLEAADKENPMNPDVHVEGLGVYDLDTLKISLKRNIKDLLGAVETLDSARTWRNLKTMIDAGVIQAKADAIVDTYDHLQAKRRKGGAQSRGIEKE